MSKVRSTLSPEITKIILNSYSVVKKRSPLQFFKEEKHEKSNKATSNLSPEQGAGTTVTRQVPNQCKNLMESWHNMSPELKRKYFYKAEFDEVRYKGQRSVWVAEIGSLLVKNRNQPDKLLEEIPKLLEKQKIIHKSLEKYQENLENMIQAQTTRSLYKNVIEKTKQINPYLDSDSLILSVPTTYRTILERPRRPPSAFILYAVEHKEKFSELRKTEQYKTIPNQRIAAIFWNKMDMKDRQKYEDTYNQLMKEYEAAMEKYRQNGDDDVHYYLDQVSKERRSFFNNLRRHLREYLCIPVNIRNAFNFFLMDKKSGSLKDMTEIWRNMSEHEKQKYHKLAVEDKIRYYSEKKLYDELIEEILSLIKQHER